MTKVMAVEWAPLGIRVNCLAPRYIHSYITEGLSRRGSLDGDALRKRIPKPNWAGPKTAPRRRSISAARNLLVCQIYPFYQKSQGANPGKHHA